MTESPDHFVTAAASAAALVLRYAPLLRRGLRLPAYPKPAVTWDIRPHVSPAWTQAVRAAWDRLDLRDPQQWSEGEALVLRYHRMHGLDKFYRLGLSAVDHHAPAAVHRGRLLQTVLDLSTLLAEKLLACLGEEDRAQYFPTHCFDVRPGRTPHTWTLLVDALVPQTTPDGQVCYQSWLKPTAVCGGVRLPVAFTPHAIQRLQERRTVASLSHASRHDLFAFLNYGQYFESATLHPQQPAIALFDCCTPGSVQAHFAARILGTAALPQPMAYRLGYCPVVREGHVWLAKTFVMPGFIGTPEYSVLYRTSLDQARKAAMLAACEELTFVRLVQSDDVSLLRWFHSHGVPQVIPEPQPFFVYE